MTLSSLRSELEGSSSTRRQCTSGSSCPSRSIEPSFRLPPRNFSTLKMSHQSGLMAGVGSFKQIPSS